MSKVEEMITCVYKKPNVPIEDRIKDLVPRMTLQEKIGQMTQIELRVATPDDVRDLSIGIPSSPFFTLHVPCTTW